MQANAQEAAITKNLLTQICLRTGLIETGLDYLSSRLDWTRQAVGQQHNNNTPAPFVLEVRRAVAQLLLVNRARRELLHLRCGTVAVINLFNQLNV